MKHYSIIMSVQFYLDEVRRLNMKIYGQEQLLLEKGCLTCPFLFGVVRNWLAPL